MSEKRCIGCGALLQVLDAKIVGYVDKDIYNRDEDIYCSRCFKLKNYQVQSDVVLSEDDYLSVVHQIGKTDSLIISLVDIFDFSGSFISSLKRHTGQTDIILVGNKFDLLPKSVKPYKITRWMRHMANLEGFKVLDCLLVSAKTGDNIDALMNAIDKYSANREVYVVGTCNVGKSTLINTIIKKYSDVRKDIITTSIIPGTTLDFIKIPYEKNYIIDTPGLINNAQMIHRLSASDLKIITPRKEIKPIGFQINPEQTIFVGGLAAIDYLEGERMTFVCYFSNDLYLHRTNTNNKERLLETKYGTLLKPAISEKYDATLFQNSQFFVPNDEKKYDVVISGLGFITLNKGCKIRVHTLKGVGVYLREAII